MVSTHEAPRPRAGGEDEEVVRDLAPLLVDRHHAPLGVHLVDVRHEHRGVPLPAQQVADGRGDVPRREDGRRHLVEQGLEEVVVPAVEERDADGGLVQRARHGESSEPAADDDHLRL